MDINDIRTAVTVLGFVLFLTLVVRTWRPRDLRDHEQASQLVLEGETEVLAGATGGAQHG